MRDYVLMYINSTRYEIRGDAVFQPLSTYLRDTLHLTGTKIVCAEGDCGSCTVLLGSPASGKISHKPVCGCIQYLYQLDCTHVITVEGLKYDGQLNPVQESMVRLHGAQCGFCTPGFVVAACSLLDNAPQANAHALQRGLVGNLCRCTGYESIVKSCMDVDASQLRPIASLFDMKTITDDLASHQTEPVTVSTADGRTLFKPVSVSDAAVFRAAHPDTVIISGGTDLGVQTNKGFRQIKTVMSTRGLSELNAVAVEHNTIVAGACASLTDLETTASRVLPEYARLLQWFGSPPIKNAGTVGGNIANGSPIGDTMPAMYVLNAEIELTGRTGSRRVNINDFYTGYKRNVMAADELITRVYIPLPAKGEIFKLFKLSKRKDLDISSFTAAIWMHAPEGRIADVRIAYGGVGPTILRLKKTEAMLKGQLLSEDSMLAAGQIARTEITPISDVRGEADYRLQLAENILLKFFAELTEPALPLTAIHVNGHGRGAT